MLHNHGSVPVPHVYPISTQCLLYIYDTSTRSMSTLCIPHIYPIHIPGIHHICPHFYLHIYSISTIISTQCLLHVYHMSTPRLLNMAIRQYRISTPYLLHVYPISNYISTHTYPMSSPYLPRVYPAPHNHGPTPVRHVYPVSTPCLPRVHPVSTPRLTIMALRQCDILLAALLKRPCMSTIGTLDASGLPLIAPLNPACAGSIILSMVLDSLKPPGPSLMEDKVLFPLSWFSSYWCIMHILYLGQI